MAYTADIIEKGAVLYDIGRLLCRASIGTGSYVERGVAFLAPYMQDGADGLVIMQSLGRHLPELMTKPLASDDMNYILAIADAMARGARPDIPADKEEQHHLYRPLANVFNHFSGKGEDSAFLARAVDGVTDLPYPLPLEDATNTKKDYQGLVHSLETAFQRQSPAQLSIHELMQVLSTVTTYIPARTDREADTDISLYDQQKITAAYAVCLYLYFQDAGISEYQAYCVGDKWQDLQQTKALLLVSGDISGIQDFIYTIPSKGALKSLRGRSFYLDFLLEHIADEILQAVGVSRNCLLYTGGGHFYLLLPNIPSVHQILQDFSKRINDWFLRLLGNRLALMIGTTPCTVQECMTDSAAAFRRVSQELMERKLQRYDVAQLRDLCSPTSALNRVPEGTRECAICHQSVPSDTLQAYGEGEENACPYCRNLLLLGQRILAGQVVAIAATPAPDALTLPGYEGEVYAYARTLEQIQADMGNVKRLYVKPDVHIVSPIATKLWVGDYTARDEDGAILDFKTIASYSGGSLEATGIPRLGVMRADVDNLGAAFVSGFSKPYDTLIRKAALSRQLSVFFKGYINAICCGQLQGQDEQSFSLFGVKKDRARHVHIIYAGGDDMFLVGAWDDLIELAVDIRRKFGQFTNHKLTFSAGIGFFNPACPISEMARATGDLESLAKNNPGKDSIMLFGEHTEWHNGTKEEPAVFSWKQFVDTVCGEKLAFWRTHFQAPNGTDGYKLYIGKSGIYRLLSLLEAGTEDMNIARFAYTLARLEPTGSVRTTERSACYTAVRKQLYAWYCDAVSRRELETALRLVIYQERE